MKTHTTEQDVRYAETDRMKVAHHSAYLLWFEIGRTGLLKSAGFPYHELEISGTLFPVIEYSCRLVGAADYGDRVRVVTHIESLKSRAVVFSYRTFVGNKLIATGMTKHVCVDQRNKIHRMSEELLRALEEYVGTKP